MQFTFKMAPAGHKVVQQLMDKVEAAGFKRPSRSDIGRCVFSVVMNDPNIRNRIFANLTREGEL